MEKLDSMWWHNDPKNGPYALSHLGIIFCALMNNNMISSDISNMEFNEIPAFTTQKLSPLEYLLAYTDGVMYDSFIKPKFRRDISEMYKSEEIFNLINEVNFLDHANTKSTYTLKDTWANVGKLSDRFLEILN